MGWLVVTHVCRSWRNAALAYPRLWTAPAFQAGVKWAEEMLLRSQNAPLYLDFYRAPATFPYDEYLSKDISRIVTLRIAEKHLGPEDKWISLPAPALESLELIHLHYDLTKSLSLTDITALPSDLFSGLAPNLRSVNVGLAANFFWGASALRNVSHLVIGDRFSTSFRPPTYDYPSYDQLLSGLANMPMLETLHLTLCLPDELPPTDRLPTNLSHLESLLLCDKTQRCLGVLQHIHAPNACLSIDVPLTKWEAEDNDPAAEAIPVLQNHFSASNSSIRSTNALKISSSFGPSYISSNRVIAGMDPSPGDWDIERKFETLGDARDESRLPLGLVFPTEEEDLLPFSADLCSSIPLPSIRILALDLPSEDWDLPLWTAVSQNFPAVEDLMLTGDLAISFLEQCAPQILGGWERLQHLHLGSVESDYLSSPESGFEEALVGWLRSYQEVSLRPPTIRLTSATGDANLGWIDRVKAYTQVEIHLERSPQSRFVPFHDAFGRRILVERTYDPVEDVDDEDVDYNYDSDRDHDQSDATL